MDVPVWIQRDAFASKNLKFNYLEHSCTDGIEYQVVAVAIATEKQNWKGEQNKTEASAMQFISLIMSFSVENLMFQPPFSYPS